METNKEKKTISMNEVLMQTEIQRSNQRKRQKEDKKELLKTVIVSTIISLIVVYFSKVEILTWGIPITLVSSLVSTVFVDNERKNETKYFFSLWLGTTFNTFIICLILYFIVIFLKG